jgi:hypothetical protein
MSAQLQPNEVNLFGQRFHACVGITYIGLGFILCNGLRRWFPPADWLPLLGMVMLFGGAAWWLVLWRRRGPSPG